MHIHERNTERKRLNGLMLKSPMKVYAAFSGNGGTASGRAPSSAMYAPIMVRSTHTKR